MFLLRENTPAGTILSCNPVNGEPVTCNDTFITATDADNDTLTFSLAAVDSSSALSFFEVSSLNANNVAEPGKAFIRSRLALNYESLGSVSFLFQVVVRDGLPSAPGKQARSLITTCDSYCIPLTGFFWFGGMG